MIVVDASLAAKWTVPEPDSSRALDFLATYGSDLHGPDLIFVEVASAIVRRANADRSLAAAALDALDKWTAAWPLHVIRSHRVTQRRLFDAGTTALQLGHPIKDCIYLALAIEFDCDLATCDARFATKARDRWPRVRLLADYPTAA